MRQLLFVHRWIGVVLAVFMLGWFGSGLVIANSGGLGVSRERQLAHAESLSPEASWLSLGEALEKSAAARVKQSGGGADLVAEARLVRRAGAPFWLVESDSGRRIAISAVDGRVKNFSVEEAPRLAHDWLAVDGPVPAVAYVDTVDATPGLRNAEGLKPFHRVSVADGAGTVLIISAKSGEVLQAATRLSRAVNYAGNWLHLFRPLDLLGAGDYRRSALTYAGLFAFVGALTGVVIGWIKWKPGFFGRPTYARGRTQPYRETWLKYHFWAGLVGGAFAVIWAGSGFLSTNPGEIFTPATPSREELARYRGGDLPDVIRDWSPAAAVGLGAETVELRWSRLGEEAVLLSYAKDGSRKPIKAAGGVENFAEASLVAAVRRLAGDKPIASVETLRDYDSYYFTGHGQGRAERPLPALRVDLADSGKTSVYLDPQDGRLLLRLDNSRRIYRWLYSAVHHWDFGWFREFHLARRVWIVVWAGLGLVLATSAVVLAWRRLRRSLPERAPQPEKSRSPSPARA
jgi:hypothetical protein